MNTAPFNLSRRQFVKSCLAAPLILSWDDELMVNTVTGPKKATEMGVTLIHEHILVDFIGADKIDPSRWEHEAVMEKVLPFVLEAKSKGIQTILECTPAFLGRDVKLLEKISEKTGVTFLTNTGYYGASDNKYLPEWAHTETAEELASRWIGEFRRGIDGTGIKPGFIKTGVNPDKLSELHEKLIVAAAIAHRSTGLTICSHTGPALPAQQELAILKERGVSPKAFVWVHANGTNEEIYKTAYSGCWISLDGINPDNVQKNVELISYLKTQHMLGQVLISHDAGWYRPGEAGGGELRGYTAISDHLLPALKENGFTDADIRQLMVENPANAFAIRTRKI